MDGICPAEATTDPTHSDVSSNFQPEPPLLCATDNITVYYQNVRGLRTKIDDLFLAVSESNFDVIVLTETWLNDQIYSPQLFGDRFTVYRNDRSSGTSSKKRGGGVLIAVTTRLSSALPSVDIDRTIEHLWVNIYVVDCVIAIGAVYLSPDISNDVSIIDKHIDSALNISNSLKSSDYHVLLGDFNQPNLVWSNASSGYLYADTSRSSFSQASSDFLDGYALLDMKQMNSIKNHRDRILDLIFINSDAATKCSVLIVEDPLVDPDPYHPALFVSLTCNKPVEYDGAAFVSDYDFKRSDFETLSHVLLHTDWTSLTEAPNVDNAVLIFTNTLNQLFHHHVPAPPSPRKPPWSNDRLRHLKRCRSSALRRYTNTRTVDLKRIFNAASHKYRSYNKLLYVRYTKRMESSLKRNPKRFWSFINEKRKETGLPKTVFLNDEVADTSEKTCNLFAKHFTDVFRNDPVPSHLVDSALVEVPHDVLDIGNFSFSQRDVLMAIKKMKPSAAVGPDGIPSIILVKCAESLIIPLTVICNRSIAESKFPTQWKESFMFPVHKKGDKRNVSNYRGITSLCAGSKLLEILIGDVLFSASKSYISPDQHGFFPGRSIDTNLLQFTSYCLTNIENGNQVDTVYTDLKAAFDRVDHRILVAKMDRLGAPLFFTRWLESYLMDRRLSVKLGAAQSNYFTNRSGVPQGSNLGPLLFSIFFNDLCHLLPSGVRLVYADDLKIYIIIRNNEDCMELQRMIDMFQAWCFRNHMVISAQKCSVISFSRKKTPIIWNYQICGTQLQRENAVKDLGVILDTSLSFRDHYSSIIAKANRNLGFIIRSTKEFTDPHSLRSLYYSLVRSTLETACVVWSPHTDIWMSRIEAIQAKFTRYALRLLPWNNIANMPSYEVRCRLLGMETLHGRRDSTRALFAGKVLLGVVDAPWILQKINLNAVSVSLRRRDPLRMDFRRTDYGLNEPILAMCREFNKVYELFDYTTSAAVFKNRLKQRLLEA